MIFAVKSQANSATHPHDLDQSIDRFSESLYDHKDSVTSIEKSQFENFTQFLTTSKDGQLIVWEFIPNNGKEEGNSTIILAPIISQENVLKKICHIDNIKNILK